MPYSDMEIAPEGTLGADSTADDIYRVGLAYAVGVECEIDLIAAHKWFNLAAVRGHEEAKIQRAEMAEMISSEELQMALQAAREWLKLIN